MKCLLCDSDTFDVVSTNHIADVIHAESLPEHLKTVRYSFTQCTKCGLVFLNNGPLTDDLHYFYSDDYCCYQRFNERGFIFSTFEKVLGCLKLYHLKKYLDGNDKTLLDFGCGNGSWAKIFQNKFNNLDIVLTDISNNQIDALKKEGFNAFICSDADVNVKIQPSSIDIIHLFHVIEHVSNPLELFFSFNRILKVNGVIIGQTPNVDSLERKILKEYWNHWHPPQHRFLFNERTLAALAERTGFVIVNISSSPVAATQWAAGVLRVFAQKKRRQFLAVREPLYPLFSLCCVPITLLQMLLGYKTSNMNFILRKI